MDITTTFTFEEAICIYTLLSREIEKNAAEYNFLEGIRYQLETATGDAGMHPIFLSQGWS